MLMPKKVKHRKVQRGRMRGQAKGGKEVTFGQYGPSPVVEMARLVSCTPLFL